MLPSNTVKAHGYLSQNNFKIYHLMVFKRNSIFGSLSDIPYDRNQT